MDELKSNRMYGGDNLHVLRRHIADESVDLIYLDPPFNTDRKYHFRSRDTACASRTKDPLEAFGDIWRWDETAAASLEDITQRGGRISDALHALRHFLGFSDLLAYLAMMAPRLVELERVLKTTGTIYVHCDPTASHYLKMLLDAVFGPRNMRNEIVWCYRGGGVPKKDFARKHDIIFRYSKSDHYLFDVDAVRIPYSDDVLNSVPSRYDKSYRMNKVYSGYRPHPEGKHPEDWWPIQAILPSSSERLGYPTQKPAELIQRIIKASSQPGGVVLDPFCGSGTTLAVAQRLKRHWIGVDVSTLALQLTESRLLECCPKNSFQVIHRRPRTEPTSSQLARNAD